jgi:hypothetical protein
MALYHRRLLFWESALWDPQVSHHIWALKIRLKTPLHSLVEMVVTCPVAQCIHIQHLSITPFCPDLLLWDKNECYFTISVEIFTNFQSYHQLIHSPSLDGADAVPSKLHVSVKWVNLLLRILKSRFQTVPPITVFWLGSFTVLLTPSRQILVVYIRLLHCRVLPRSMQLFIHHTSCYSSLYTLSTVNFIK